MLDWLMKWIDPPTEEMEADFDVPLYFNDLPLEKKVEVLYIANRDLTAFVREQTRAYMKMAQNHNALKADFEEVLQQLILMAENYKVISDNQQKIMTSIMGVVEELEEDDTFGDLISNKIH